MPLRFPLWGHLGCRCSYGTEAAVLRAKSQTLVWRNVEVAEHEYNRRGSQVRVLALLLASASCPGKHIIASAFPSENCIRRATLATVCATKLATCVALSVAFLPGL